jgi:hypothetical protein
MIVGLGLEVLVKVAILHSELHRPIKSIPQGDIAKHSGQFYFITLVVFSLSFSLLWNHVTFSAFDSIGNFLLTFIHTISQFVLSSAPHYLHIYPILQSFGLSPKNQFERR